MRIYTFLLPALLLANAAQGGSRTSADYQIPTEVFDSGGVRAASASYTNDGSVGGIAGLSTAPDVVAKHGYVAQLFELTGVTFYTDQNPREQEAAGQLYGYWQADDLSYGYIAGNQVAWSILDGPVDEISSAGLMTGGMVAQDMPATVRGVFGSFTANLALTVLDLTPDNFGSYAGDGLDDGWQVQYFGVDNSNAAPGADPDGDGQTNSFEFTAGLLPDNPESRLRLEITSGSTPTERRLVFHPRLPDRTYAVEYRAGFGVGDFAPLSGTSVSDVGDTRTVTDPDAGAPTRFYRVLVTKP